MSSFLEWSLVYKHLNDSCFESFEWYFEDLEIVIVHSNLCKGISLSFQMKLKSFDLLFPTFPRCFPWLRLKRLVFLHFVKLCALKNVGDTFLPISYCCAFGGCEEKSLSHSGKTFLHFFFEIAFPGGHYDIWKDKKQQILILLDFVMCLQTCFWLDLSNNI